MSKAETQVRCRFCALLAGAPDTFESTWLSDGPYRAIASVGALVHGWSLVCPLDHSSNLTAEYRRPKFWTFASTVVNVIERQYGPCVYFEHGTTRADSLTGCGVGHAHGHFVPLGFSLEDQARRVAPELNWFGCAADDLGKRTNGREYLFVSGTIRGAATAGSACILDAPISQFFRRLIARELGMADMYDYKRYPMADLAAASARELRAIAGATEKA